MASAATKLFGVAELFEHILINTKPCREDLFILQRVSHSFNDTINGSTPLLRIMNIIYDPASRVTTTFKKLLTAIFRRNGRFRLRPFSVSRIVNDGKIGKRVILYFVYFFDYP